VEQLRLDAASAALGGRPTVDQAEARSTEQIASSATRVHRWSALTPRTIPARVVWPQHCERFSARRYGGRSRSQLCTGVERHGPIRYAT
jgi:hypothetical protein